MPASYDPAEMVKKNLYEPFEIVLEDLHHGRKIEHRSNFFELVYVLSGTGVQYINQNKFAYRPGNLFLITPIDRHAFEVEEVSRFFLIRFNDIYIGDQKPEKDLDWIRRMEFILYHASHQPGCILYHKQDKVFVDALVQAMMAELSDKEIYHRELLSQMVSTMITLVARNIAMALPEKMNDSSECIIVDIISYIQENIYRQDSLKTNVIADRFGISESYLGRYFKKHTGESLKQYIITYKLKLVDMRLRHSNMRINEIVSELGFTDESHLYRIFKKHRGLNPTAFRRKPLKPEEKTTE